jgi:hypothetical protein
MELVRGLLFGEKKIDEDVLECLSCFFVLTKMGI